MPEGQRNKKKFFHGRVFGYLAAVNLTEQMTRLAAQAKAASRELAKLTAPEKNACLLAMADALENHSAALKEANALDMEVGAKMNLSPAMLDRLNLDDKRVAAMAKGLREVAALPDPVGRVLEAPGQTDSSSRKFPRPSASWSSFTNRVRT